MKNDTSVYIEYELLPYFPAWLERYLTWRNIDYVVDYDDAIFHNYDWKGNTVIKFFLANKIPLVMRLAKTVITGSEYLSAFAKRYNSNIVEIPTSISFKKYDAVAGTSKGSEFTIGWIGTPSSSKNVVSILPGIQAFLQKYPSRLVLIGFDRSLQNLFEGWPIEIKDWKEETEIADMRSFDVGIMPLDDTPFNRGKCGFKLVQYMGCGLPTVFSPLQANVNINKDDLNVAASLPNDWFIALEKIYNNIDHYKNVVGAKNKELVRKYYSIEANHEAFIKVFK